MNRESYNNFFPTTPRDWDWRTFHANNHHNQHDYHYQTSGPLFPRFFQPHDNLEEVRGASNLLTREPSLLTRPSPLTHALPMRFLVLNNGMSRTSPPALFMGPSNSQGNRSTSTTTVEDGSRLIHSQQKKALEKLKKEIYNPIPKKLASRLSLYYRDRALDVVRDTNKRKDYKEDEDDKRCAVCLEDFEPKEMVMVTPCKHMFHEDCIVPWVKSHGQCPVCRYVLWERDQAPENNHNNNSRNQQDELSVAELISMLRDVEDTIIWGNVGI